MSDAAVAPVVESAADRTEAVTELASTSSPKDTPVENAGDWVSEFIAPPTPVEEPAKPVPEKAEAVKEPSPDKGEKADKAPKVDKVEEPVEDKRLKDTRDYATRVNQQNLALSTQLKAALEEIKTMKAQLDGTYVPPEPPSKEAIEAKAVELTKFAASGYAAVELYGQDTVDQLIFAPDAPFQKLSTDPQVMARVNAAHLPVVEAIKIVREHEQAEKYGHDPKEIREKLRAEIEADIRKDEAEKTRKAVAKELQEKGRLLPKPVVGLGEVRGVGKVDARKSDDQPLTMTDLFPNFTPTAF